MSYKELYLAMLSPPSNSGKVEGLLGIPYYNYHDPGRDHILQGGFFRSKDRGSSGRKGSICRFLSDQWSDMFEENI